MQSDFVGLIVMFFSLGQPSSQKQLGFVGLILTYLIFRPKCIRNFSDSSEGCCQRMADVYTTDGFASALVLKGIRFRRCNIQERDPACAGSLFASIHISVYCVFSELIASCVPSVTVRVISLYSPLSARSTVSSTCSPER